MLMLLAVLANSQRPMSRDSKPPPREAQRGISGGRHHASRARKDTRGGKELPHQGAMAMATPSAKHRVRAIPLPVLPLPQSSEAMANRQRQAQARASVASLVIRMKLFLGKRLPPEGKLEFKL